MDMTETVVVGVDGSAESREALGYALDEAARRYARLRVVTAVLPAEYGVTTFGMPVAPSPEEILADAYDALRQTVDLAVGHRDDTPTIQVEVLSGRPAAVLIDASRDADLLVVGHRGRGGFAGLLLGSVAMHCVQHAACPVAVIRSKKKQEG